MRITEPDWLVADIGGTNIRFGIANAGPSGSPALRQVQSLRVSEFGSLTEAVGNYLLNVDEHVKGAVFGVAGRVVGGVAQMTNLAWTINASELAQALTLDHVEIINDLAAAAAALPAMNVEDAQLLWPCATPVRNVGIRRCAIVGAGTGLGIASAQISDDSVRVLDTEGGHTAYAPQTAQENAMAQALYARLERVSWECVVSGPGLVNVYRALQDDGIDSLEPTPEQIISHAHNGSDRRSNLAVALFSQALAAVAGDCVLMHGAWDGIYLMGELLKSTRPWLEHPDFRSRFMDKGPFAGAMANVPVRLISHSQPVLLGAACIALTKNQSEMVGQKTKRGNKQ